MVDRGFIAPDDLTLLTLTDDVDEIVSIGVTCYQDRCSTTGAVIVESP